MNTKRAAKTFAGVAFAVLAGAIALTYVATSEEDARAAAAPINITAEKLQAAFDANEVAADNKYGDAYLSLNGSIVDISDGVLGPSLTLDAGGFFATVAAVMAGGQAKAVAALHKGQTVTLRCHGAGMSLGQVRANDCAVE